MIDNDCDGNTDCYDPDCSGIDGCPICGDVMHTETTPLELPDGDGAGPPYTETVNFSGFGTNQEYAVGNILSVCVNMEHSWMRDLEVRLYAPSPTTGIYDTDSQYIVLSQQLGDSCPQGICEVFIGEAHDDDDNAAIPGNGKDYCWTPDATNEPWLIYANDSMPMDTYMGASELPPDNYMIAGDLGLIDNDWSPLVGAPLNGGWTIYVQDKWASDNGFIFDWSITFDPQIVQTCTTPPVQ
jgi:subtilisin-like proprotein convertase family protein